MPRSFIAIEFPIEIQNQLLVAISGLSNAFPPPTLRWVKTGNIHLTLKFLGEVDMKGLAQFASAIQDKVNGLTPFILSFSELGLFPGRGLPRILWIGIRPVPELTTLNASIESAAEQLGHDRETRPFSPHLTIARVGDRFQSSRSQELVLAARQVDLSRIPSIEVNSVVLFKSDLHPEGPVYSILNSIHF